MIEVKLRQAKRLVKQGKLTAARRVYLGILASHPKNAAALQGLRGLRRPLPPSEMPSQEQLNGLSALHQRGEHDELLRQTQALLARYPEATILHNIIGGTHRKLERWEQAAAAYEQAIGLPPPGDVEALRNLGWCRHQQGDLDAAGEHCRAALRLDANDADAHSNLGVLHKDRGEFDKAVAQQRRALQINPKHALAHTRMGVALKQTGDYEQALACHRRAIEIDPNLSAAWNNMIVTHLLLGRHDAETMASFNQYIERRPDDIGMRAGRSLMLLLTGDFANGWREYEYRPTGSQGTEARKFPRPLWLGGGDIAGKTLLIHSDQGFGDTLQFCRYVKMAADLGARVVFEAQAKLLPLFAPFKAYCQLVSIGTNPLPAFDLHCPLLSLPLAFATELATIPPPTDCVQAPPAKIEHWRRRLGRRGKASHSGRVGLVWRGNPRHGRDRDRSIPLATLLPYLPPDYEYISLQHEVADEDRPLLPQLRHFGEEFDGFDDAAAVCLQLDVLVSVDTSMAHLGGALNVPTWILLPYSPDFRWLLGRGDSPWYPSVRLFRQPAVGDWDAALTAVRQALVQKAEGFRAPRTEEA